MRRREFILALGAAAAAWPLPLRAQQPMPVIGFLGAASEAEWVPCLTGFRGGLVAAWARCAGDFAHTDKPSSAPLPTLQRVDEVIE